MRLGVTEACTPSRVHACVRSLPIAHTTYVYFLMYQLFLNDRGQEKDLLERIAHRS